MAAQNTYRSQAYTPQNQQLEQVFKQQQDFVTQLQQAAQGQGPSAATAMLQQAQQANTAQANALAASQQGNINAGLATRNAMQQAAQANQAATGQAQVMRNQEQLQARQMLGGQLGTMMGQGMGAQQAKDTLNANIEQKNVESQNSLIRGITGGVFGAVGAGLGALSDERAKENIHDGSDDVRDMLDKLEPHSYNYKGGSEPHTSVMAQELEKSKAGSQMVKEAPNGLKMVDYGQGLAAILAAQADLHKRLKAIEGGKPKMAEGGEVNPNAVKAPSFDMTTFTSEVLGGATKGMAIDDPIAKGGAEFGEGLGTAIKSGMDTSKKKANEARMREDNEARAGIGLAKGGKVSSKVLAAKGKAVPGKAKVSGDSLSNDIVDAKLSPGEIVLPRSVTMHPEAPQKAAEFVAHILANKHKGR